MTKIERCVETLPLLIESHPSAICYTCGHGATSYLSSCLLKTVVLDPDGPITKTPPSDETSVTSLSFGTLPWFSDISLRARGIHNLRGGAFRVARSSLLGANFGINLLSFAILSNHFHLILRSRPDVFETWDSSEVASPTSPTTWLVSEKRQGMLVFFHTTFRVCEFELVIEVRACLAESFDVP